MNQNSESCYTNSTCATEPCAETRKEHTTKLAAVALGTALILSLVGAFNLDKDVKLVTNSQVPYIQQRLDNIEPGLIAAASQKHGM